MRSETYEADSGNESGVWDQISSEFGSQEAKKRASEFLLKPAILQNTTKTTKSEKPIDNSLQICYTVIVKRGMLYE